MEDTQAKGFIPIITKNLQRQVMNSSQTSIHFRKRPVKPKTIFDQILFDRT